MAISNQIGCATAHPRSYRPTSTVQIDSFSESYLRDSAFFFGSPTGLADGSGCQIGVFKIVYLTGPGHFVRPSVRASALPAPSYLPPKKKTGRATFPEISKRWVEMSKSLSRDLRRRPNVTELSQSESQSQARPCQAEPIAPSSFTQLLQAPQFVFPASGRGCVVNIGIAKYYDRHRFAIIFSDNRKSIDLSRPMTVASATVLRSGTIYPQS